MIVKESKKNLKGLLDPGRLPAQGVHGFQRKDKVVLEV